VVTKIIKWAAITGLLLAVTWRPSASYQLPLDLAVCTAAVLVVLALFSIKHRVETHYAFDNRPAAGKQITVSQRPWRS